MSGNKILISIKGYNSVTNLRKMTGNNPNLHLVNIEAYTKFGQILSVNSKDIEWKVKILISNIARSEQSSHTPGGREVVTLSEKGQNC